MRKKLITITTGVVVASLLLTVTTPAIACDEVQQQLNADLQYEIAKGQLDSQLAMERAQQDILEELRQLNND
jgi:hypothetical protein